MFGNRELSLNYQSSAQKARRVSEDWVARNSYCLACRSDALTQTTPNTKSRDFICSHCNHAYELKSKCGSFGSKVLDGAYGAMIETIQANRTPTFLLLEYSPDWSIDCLTAIHHSLITEKSIIARKPLSAGARRAGWVGCNIVMPSIASDGKIHLVRDGLRSPVPRSEPNFPRWKHSRP